jgi:hypothetical protein
MHNKNNNNNHTFKIEERRRARRFHVSTTDDRNWNSRKALRWPVTISRYVKALKEMSQQFVFDLEKSDLPYYCKQPIDGIEEAKKEEWRITL